jgi:predicted kinase
MIKTPLMQLRQLVLNADKLSRADRDAVWNMNGQYRHKKVLSVGQTKLINKIYKKFQNVSVQRLRKDAENQSISANSNPQNWRDIWQICYF